MYEIEDRVGQRSRRKVRKPPRPRVEDAVLPVPPRDLLVSPYPRADDVEGLKPLHSKQARPVALPALVNMTHTALARTGGGEQHDVAVRGQKPDKARGGSAVQVFGHLERHDEVELPFQNRWRVQVSRDETRGVDHQLGARHIVPVDADEIVDAGLGKRLE